MPETSGEEPPRGIKKEIAENPEAAAAHTGAAESVGHAAEATDVDDETSVDINSSRLMTTALILTYISAVAVSAEYSGYNDALPEVPELVATSMGHPAVGYIGGGAAGLAAHALNSSPAVRTTAIFAGASVANLIVEKAQSIAVASPGYVDFLSRQNLPETAKDYAAALLGAALLALQLRRNG